MLRRVHHDARKAHYNRMNYRVGVGVTNRANGDELDAGLCADCVHARRVESARGSQFSLCQYSAIDPTFRKYPVLPVKRCPAYDARGASGTRCRIS